MGLLILERKEMKEGNKGREEGKEGGGRKGRREEGVRKGK